MVKNQREQRRVHKGQGECWQWQANGQCTKGDQCSFRHVRNKRAKATTQPTPSPEHTTQAEGGKILAISKSPKRKVRLGKYLVNCARNIFKVLVRIHLLNSGIPSSACFTRQKRDANTVISASSHTAGMKSSPAKGRKKLAKKSAVAMVRETKNLGCVFQDMEPPKSSSSLRKSSTMQKPNRCVRFTKTTLHCAKVRDRNPSLNKICPGDPHQRTPNAPKFEDRSQPHRPLLEH